MTERETERIVHAAVDRAVNKADEIILDASDGSVEMTNLLTARVAQRLVEKVTMAADSAFKWERLIKDSLAGGVRPTIKK